MTKLSTEQQAKATYPPRKKRPSATLNLALDYAAKGYAVFPLQPEGKKPITDHGFKDATKDPEQVKRWWRATPDANIGIATGASDLVVVDLDVKHAADGLRSWDDRTTDLDLPEPVVVHTPSGGLHLYYQADPDAERVGNSADEDSGIDVRADGGYVVAPGSCAAEGFYYLDMGDGGPDPDAVADLPHRDQLQVITRDVVAATRPRKTRERSERHDATTAGQALYPDGQRHALWYEYDKLASAGDGGRNHQLNDSVFALAQIASAEGAAVTESDVRTMTERACHANGLIEGDGWSAFNATFASAWSAGSDQPRTLGTEEERLDGEVAQALHRLRVQDEAKRIFREEQAARDFEMPGDLRSLVDDLAAPREEDAWLVEGLIPAGGNLVIAAAYKTGKTTLVQNLTRSLVDGEPFLDRYAVSPIMGRVALFNFELTRTQQLAWLEESGIQAQDRVMLAHLRGMRGVLTTEAGKQWAVEQLRANSVQVWIVDPFARAASGIDENSNTEVGLFLETLDEIKRRAGVSELVLITHTGRGNADEPVRARGATRLNDWADTNMVVTKTAAGQRSLVAEGRDVWINKTLLSYDLATRRLTAADGEEAGVSEAHDLQAVLEYVTAQGEAGASLRDIRTANIAGVKGGKDHRDPLIQVLATEGAVSRSGPKKGGHLTYVATGSPPQTEMEF